MKKYLQFIVGLLLGFLLALAVFNVTKMEAKVHDCDKVCTDWKWELQCQHRNRWGLCTDWDLVKVCKDWECKVDPTPTPEPSVEPSEVPACTNCPPAPELWKPPEYKPAVCSVSLPAKPTFTYQRLDPTTVKVFWDMNDENTTGYSFSWGYEFHNLPYGALNVPVNAREFTIGNLEANKNIFVEMSRWNGNECRSISDRVDP